MWCRRLRVVILGILASTALAAAQEAPALKNVRWQILPPDFRTVTVGRDGRPWYTKAGTPINSESFAAIKKQIQEQWNAPVPVLEGTRPVLFEKSGRIWFLTADRTLLLGYDGSQFVERVAELNGNSPGRFEGEAPNHGRMSQVPINVDTGDAQVFPETNGIAVYEGGQWTLHPTVSAANRTQLLADPAAKLLIAVQPNPAKIWRYESAKWSEIAVPAAVGTNIQSAALQPSGTLLVRGQVSNSLIRLAITTPAGGDLEKQFNTHLNKIDNHDSDVADAAAQAIADMGPPVIPLVKKVLENIVDADAERRLSRALGQLSGDAPLSFKIGGMEVPNAQYVYNDPLGNVFVWASGVPDSVAAGGTGTYVLRPGGKYQLVPGNIRIGFNIAGPVPVASADGKTLWLPSNINNAGIVRLDLAADSATQVRLPNPDFWFIHAVLPDGTLFLSPRAPAFPAPSNAAQVADVLVAFKPGAPEERKVINAAATPIGDALPAMAGDGSLWAAQSGQGISRYDGAEWSTPHALQAGMIFGGRSGEVLISPQAVASPSSPSVGTFAFLGKDASLSSLQDIVQTNSAALAEAFAGGDPTLFRRSASRWTPSAAWEFTGDGGFSIAVDDQKRIWMTQSRQLRVFGKGGWINVEWPAENGASPSLTMPIADGSAMYLWSARTGGARSASQPTDAKAFIATMEGNTVRFNLAPWTGLAPFRDADGNLWIMRPRVGNVGRSVIPTTVARPLVVERLGVKGVIDTFDISGMPLLRDLSGYVWIAAPNDELELWKDGKIAGKFKVPYASLEARLFSDKPGSVWIWTLEGLQHWTAAEGTAAYERKGLYAVESEDGNLFRLNSEAGVSPKGFLFAVLYDPSDLRRTRRKIYTVALPRE